MLVPAQKADRHCPGGNVAANEGAVGFGTHRPVFEAHGPHLARRGSHDLVNRQAPRAHHRLRKVRFHLGPQVVSVNVVFELVVFTLRVERDSWV
jgi:hypothetical protein